MIVNRVTLLGNKDHGKSTLIGSLLMQTKSVSQQRIDDARKTSRKLGRKFEPGYILDSFEEERLNEMTIDTTRAQIRYKNTGFEFIDVPGHEELMKNMLSGASYADFALLLVSAKSDEGITSQTKRHLFVAKMMGIKKVIVAVNKLDTVNYDRSRFEEIREGLGDYLGRIGFGKDNVHFIPISAYSAENLVRRSKKARWYRGESLMEMLAAMTKAKPQRKNPGRSIVLLQGFLGDDRKSIFGKVISGSISNGDRIVVLPDGGSATVTGLFVSGGKRRRAGKGNAVTLEVDTAFDDVKGSVACLDDDPCGVSGSIRALFFDMKPLRGRVTIKMNGAEIQCRRIRVEKSVNIASGDVTEGGGIRPLQASYVEMLLARKVPFGTFDEVPELGRFVAYSDRKFAGIGVVVGMA